MNNIYYVYLYCYPDEPEWFYDFSLMGYINKPFYVGKGKGKRIYTHINETNKNTTNLFKFRIIQSIRQKNKTPVIMKYKEHLTNDDAYSLERELVTLFGRRNTREQGVLSNISPGGDCGPVLCGEQNGFFGKRHSIEKRKLISKNTKAAMARPDIHRKLIAAIDKRDTSGSKNSMYNKTVYGQWVNKFGEEEANIRMDAYRKTMSISTSGALNGNYNSTTDLEQIKQLVLSKMPLAKIQKELKIGRTCLENRLTELGIPISLPLRKKWIAEH